MEQEPQIDFSHEKLEEFTKEISNDLIESGLEFTLAKVGSSSRFYGRSPRYIMNEAVGHLFNSRDESLQDLGLTYLGWEAENLPSLSKADEISYDANFDARNPENLVFAKKCFAISLSHIRNIVNSEGYNPDYEFLDTFRSVSSRINDSFNDLYISAMEEFTPLVIAGAENYEPEEINDSTGFDDKKFEIDNLLVDIYITLNGSNQEIAEKAKSLITDRFAEKLIYIEDTNRKFVEALDLNNFDEAVNILSDDEYFILSPWRDIRNRVIGTGDYGVEWGKKVIETIKRADPDYFENNAKSWITASIVAENLGLIGNTEYMKVYTSSGKEAESPVNDLYAASAYAYGLGLNNHEEAKAELFKFLDHFSEEWKDIVDAKFNEGVSDSSMYKK